VNYGDLLVYGAVTLELWTHGRWIRKNVESVEAVSFFALLRLA